jgi:hypothetical protein
MSGKKRFQECTISHITLYKGRGLTSNPSNALNNLGFAIAKIIKHHHLVAALKELHHRV